MSKIKKRVYEARQKKKERLPESKPVTHSPKCADTNEPFENGMGYPEVCRMHMIGNPEDLDSALGDYELLSRQVRFYIEIEKPFVQNGEILCPNCKKKISENFKHCPECGKRIGWKY